MTAPEQPPADAPETSRAGPTATLREVASAVFWSFFGVRKNRDMQKDAATIKPVQVLVVGIAAMLVFVLALIALVAFITRKS